jgi:heme-degrading monooxygenase HmoA
LATLTPPVVGANQQYQERSFHMFARMLEGNLKLEKRPEFLKKMREEVIPIFKKHTGFIDVIGLENETRPEKFCILTLWHTKNDAERYERETFPKVNDMMKVYLTTAPMVNTFKVETTISEHVIAAVAA